MRLINPHQRIKTCFMTLQIYPSQYIQPSLQFLSSLYLLNLKCTLTFQLTSLGSCFTSYYSWYHGTSRKWFHKWLLSHHSRSNHLEKVVFIDKLPIHLAMFKSVGVSLELPLQILFLYKNRDPILLRFSRIQDQISSGL